MEPYDFVGNQWDQMTPTQHKEHAAKQQILLQFKEKQYDELKKQYETDVARLKQICELQYKLIIVCENSIDLLSKPNAGI